MNIQAGTHETPIIYTTHHASHDFGEFADRVALTDEQRVRFSDYGTDLTVPINGIAAIIAGRSRALGDLNRDPDDAGRFQDQDYNKPDRHDIWKPGMGLTDAEKQYCQETFHDPFHAAIVEELKRRKELTFVVSWDNTAHYTIGKDEVGNDQLMRPFILSNRGREDSALALDGEVESCDPAFLELLAENLRRQLTLHDLPDEVLLNFVYKGGYIARRYSSRRDADALRQLGIDAEVQSFQLEYDTALTHDQVTLESYPEKMTALREAFSAAAKQSVDQYTAAS